MKSCRESELLLREALQAREEGDLQRAESVCREVTEGCPADPDGHVVLGLVYRAAGEAERARDCFSRAGDLIQEEPDQLVELGALCHQEGETELAISLYRRAVAADRNHHRGWYNLGTARLHRGESAEAAVAYEQALAIAPRDVDTLFNLALALSRQEKSAAAAHYYHRALVESPHDLDILYNLGLLYRKMGRYGEALRHLKRVVALAPDHASAYGHLGTLWANLDKKQRAIACFEKLVELNHKPEASRHMLAALRGETPAAPPREYVTGLFDQYADRFESELMEQLSYRVPFLLAEMLRETRGERMYDRLLDLGCGTGLVGETFVASAAEIHGVDLSGRMLEVAREKKIYDDLRQEDLLHFCLTSREEFDLVVAADVLIYLGDLHPFFQNVVRVLRPGGDLLLSLEEAEGADFILRESGRYAFAPEYLERLAAEVGLRQVTRQRTGLRREKGEWLQGWLYLFQHRAGADQAIFPELSS
jgi:predicted TPR repeat methyltransferase